jgi:serine phosphatase RsbU (regulator of sigma subunit)
MPNYSDYSSKYAPLLRLLESGPEDRGFLREHSGYSRDLEREYDSMRRGAILAYLRALDDDWRSLYQELLPVALNDPQLAEMLANLDNQLAKALRRIKVHLALERWHAIPKARSIATSALLAQMGKFRRLSVSAAAM